jgi:hypothetical protein
MFKSYGYCEEYKSNFEYEIQFGEEMVLVEDEYLYQNLSDKSFLKIQSAKSSKIKEWQEQYDFHMFHAKRTYEDAKNKVWWLPNLSWRQRGREAWVAAFSTIGAQTIQLKLVVAVSSFLCQYGLDCLDEWDYINDKLYWSKYHFEQCEIYAYKLNN